MMKKTSDLIYKSKQRKLAYDSKYSKEPPNAPPAQYSKESQEMVESSSVPYEAPARYSIINSISSE